MAVLFLAQVPDVDATVPDVSGDASVPNVSVPDVSVPDVSGSMPEVSGDVSVPDVGVSVPEVSGDVTMPSVDVDAPSTSVDVPSVDLEGKMPSVEGTLPSVEGGVSADVPSADVSVTAPDVKVEGGDASLTAGLAAGAAAAVGGIGAAVGLSGDKPSGEVDASVDVPSVDTSVDVPSAEVDASVPSVDVKKPKKGLFGGLSFKKPSLGKAKVLCCAVLCGSLWIVPSSFAQAWLLTRSCCFVVAHELEYRHALATSVSHAEGCNARIRQTKALHQIPLPFLAKVEGHVNQCSLCLSNYSCVAVTGPRCRGP